MFENVKQEFQWQFCDFHSHDSEFILFFDSFHCDPENAPSNMQWELIKLQESFDSISSFRYITLRVLFFSPSINLSSFAQVCLQNGFSFWKYLFHFYIYPPDSQESDRGTDT